MDRPSRNLAVICRVYSHAQEPVQRACRRARRVTLRESFILSDKEGGVRRRVEDAPGIIAV